MAQNETAIQSFKAGRTSIAIPAPNSEMTEVGYDSRELMEIFVPPMNRLIAGFMLIGDLPNLVNISEDFKISRYAMVQVPRAGEYQNCSSGDFEEVIDAIKQDFGDNMNFSVKEEEAEFNRRMKSLDLDEAVVSFGEPVQLGTFFSKQDVYGFGMIVPYTMGNVETKMSMGAALMRIRQRLIFVYFYAEYENLETVTWLRNSMVQWVDAILIANQ